MISVEPSFITRMSPKLPVLEVVGAICVAVKPPVPIVASIVPRPVARQPNAVAVVDSGRHFDRKALVRAHAAVASALRAGILDDRPAPLATRTGLLDREYALADPDLA